MHKINGVILTVENCLCFKQVGNLCDQCIRSGPLTGDQCSILWRTIFLNEVLDKASGPAGTIEDRIEQLFSRTNIVAFFIREDQTKVLRFQDLRHMVRLDRDIYCEVFMRDARLRYDIPVNLISHESISVAISYSVRFEQTIAIIIRCIKAQLVFWFDIVKTKVALLRTFANFHYTGDNKVQLFPTIALCSRNDVVGLTRDRA